MNGLVGRSGREVGVLRISQAAPYCPEYFNLEIKRGGLPLVAIDHFQLEKYSLRKKKKKKLTKNLKQALPLTYNFNLQRLRDKDLGTLQSFSPLTHPRPTYREIH